MNLNILYTHKFQQNLVKPLNVTDFYNKFHGTLTTLACGTCRVPVWQHTYIHILFAYACVCVRVSTA